MGEQSSRRGVTYAGTQAGTASELDSGSNLQRHYESPVRSYTFKDYDGGPDPDNNDDQLLDINDRRPLDPQDRDSFEDEDGCPDPDNDADGVLDAVDQCPIEAEDADTYEDDEGCPDPDNDSDGILDAVDQCPMQPETRNDHLDFDGGLDSKVSGARIKNNQIELDG
jgi:hypothetical protein